jgi:hydroxymethylpyrimidine pyrophosphatase-like HAD family hydrolase
MKKDILGKIKLISLDWEGTCSELGGGTSPWPIQKIGELAKILRMLWQIIGIRFLINSGRQAPYIEAAYQALGILTNMPCIFENGAGLYYLTTKRFKVNPIITPGKMMRFKDICDKILVVAEANGCIKELGKEYSLSLDPPSGMSIENCFALVQDKIQGKEKEIIEITHSQSAVDITINGVNKESGLNFLCDEERVTLDELAAVGDSRGDWPVLERVSFPMCPANATPETKGLVEKRGGYISPFPTTLGTIDCIAKMSNNPSIKKASNGIIKKLLKIG